MKKNFLGIDPSLKATGWGVIQTSNRKIIYCESGVIQQNGITLQEKIYNIYINLDMIIKKHQPMYAAIENTYVNKNPLSSLNLAHARAAALLACSMHSLMVNEYQALTIKKTITGYGKADKEQIKKMIQIYLSVDCKSADENDALAIALTDIFTKKLY